MSGPQTGDDFFLQFVPGGAPAGQAPQGPKSWWDQWLPDDDPDSFNRGEKLAATMNKAGEAMTFGLVGDEADARLKSWLPGGGTYDEELARNRQQEEILERDHPGAALGAEIGGALLGAYATRGMLPASLAAGSLGRQMAVSGGLGGLGGATYGFMEGEGAPDRVEGAKFGGGLGLGVGAFAPALGAGVQKVANARAGAKFVNALRRNAPTSGDLRAQGRALYNQVDSAGVQIRPDAFNRLTGDIRNYLAANGLDELPGPGSLTPKSARVMQIAGKMGDDLNEAALAGQNPGLPFSSLDQLRRHASTAATNMAPDAATDRALGAMTIDKLDDFVRTLGPDDVLTGDAAALKSALPKAREVWSRMLKTELVDDAIEQSDNYLSGAASGLRNQFKKILTNKKLAARFTEAERAAMKRVAQGSLPEVLIHNLGSGLSMIAGPMTGGALGSFGGPIGTVAGAALGGGAAMSARRASEAIARRNAEIARALVAKGGVNRLPVASSRVRNTLEPFIRRAGAMGAD